MFVTCSDILSLKARRVQLFCQHLDSTIGPLFRPGHVIEIAGEAGAGKTQWALQLSVCAAVSRNLKLKFVKLKRVKMGRPKPMPRRPKSYPYAATRRSFIFTSSLGVSSPTLYPTTFSDFPSNTATKIHSWIDQIGETSWPFDSFIGLTPGVKKTTIDICGSLIVFINYVEQGGGSKFVKIALLNSWTAPMIRCFERGCGLFLFSCDLLMIFTNSLNYLMT